VKQHRETPMKRARGAGVRAEKSGAASPEGAATLAIDALRWLASDLGQMSRFTVITGIDFDALRGAADNPELLAGVLDHICGDERLLVAFAADAGVAPAQVEAARQTLGGGDWEREVP
jgi:hypothetical protein